jgi:hypothetical protein
LPVHKKYKIYNEERKGKEKEGKMEGMKTEKN